MGLSDQTPRKRTKNEAAHAAQAKSGISRPGRKRKAAGMISPVRDR
jgi:hypothetical protein